MEGIRTQIVRASDGTALAVREVGPPNAPLTLVFSHGFCLNMDAWAPQQHRLMRELGDEVRLVFYDHRGHGASGDADPGTYTLAQLGDDLDTVLCETAPTGRVVLAGHSMGGMVILAFAAQHPETVRRVAGVALIATAADQLDACGLGRALRTPLVPLMHLAARTSPWLAGQLWALARNGLAPLLGIPVTKCPTLQANQHCCRMIGDTSIATIVAFLMAFRAHDQRRGLQALAHLPAVVACGEFDQITPMRHSEALAAALPHADLLRVPRAGHMLELERPGLVSSALAGLITRIRHHALVPGLPA